MLWSVTGSVKGGQELTDAQLTEVKEKFNVLKIMRSDIHQFGPKPLNIAWRTRSIPTIVEYATTRVIFKVV